MVHCGPAKGCVKCKERHVKCDLAKPECRQCARLNYICPGYRHGLDVVLRDQTASIIGHYQKKTRALPKPSRTSPQISSSLPRDITYNLEAHAVAFLFSANCFTPCGQRASHGHLDFLQPLYKKVSSTSALGLTTTWLAVVLLGMQHNNGIPYSLEDQLLSKVFESISAAVADPVNSLTNETLMAVLVLAYGEELRKRKYGQLPTWKIHQEGAEVLIRRRGVSNFQDTTSLALYGAARHNAACSSSFSEKRAKNWDLWNVRGNTRQLCDSYSPATELDAYAVTVVALRHQLIANEPSREAILRKDLLKLFECLRSWQYRIPSEWLPQITAFSTHIPLPHTISVLICQWYVIQFGAILLIQTLDMRTNAETPSVPEVWAMECLDHLVAYEYLVLSDGQEREDLSPSTYIHGVFRHATLQQCSYSPLAAWNFNKVLEKLEALLSFALSSLKLSDQATARYREVASWARREMVTLNKALALSS